MQQATVVQKNELEKSLLSRAFALFCQSKAITELYEANFKVVSKYVHATSRGHEAIQIALGLLVKHQDYLFPYYRDESMMLAIGLRPFQLMLQLMAKRDDPFSGGRSYYCHPSLRDDDKPKIPHQSSATGMQAIPAAGTAMGMQYIEKTNLPVAKGSEFPITVCSLGDASITEGEVSEALQMAALRQLPILFLIQDNGWDISAKSEEFRVNDATAFAKGFGGIEVHTIEGNDFVACYQLLAKVIDTMREERRPFLVHAKVPLLNHHTSGVRKEWYRDDLEEHFARDPYPRMWQLMLDSGFSTAELEEVQTAMDQLVLADYEEALLAEDPRPADLFTHDFAPTPITEELGERSPAGKPATVMVDCALFAIRELMEKHPECLLYGQDVGARLGGVFREAATLAQTFGDQRVFNTPIQEAFIVGSTVGMSAVGLKPIVEVQFA
ncbi:MAG: thiamine pyrophosphate-dependent enzyme, partial [Saprospiraceae bacterium]